jgi:hypothetical protein
MRNKTPFSHRLLSFFLLSFLVSCTSFSPASTATPAASFTPAATNTPLPTVTPVPPTFTPIPAPDRAKYILNTTIDYDAHTVTVDETILYPNLTGSQLNTLVIAIVPNLWDGSFTLGSISIDGIPTTTYSFTGQRLDIALSSFVLPRDVLTINIQYTLSLPFAEQEDPNVSRPRIYGYTNRQLNLTNWYPFVVPSSTATGYYMNRGSMANIWFMTQPTMKSTSNLQTPLQRPSLPQAESLNRKQISPVTPSPPRGLLPRCQPRVSSLKFIGRRYHHLKLLLSIKR